MRLKYFNVIAEQLFKHKHITNSELYGQCSEANLSAIAEVLTKVDWKTTNYLAFQILLMQSLLQHNCLNEAELVAILNDYSYYQPY